MIITSLVEQLIDSFVNKNVFTFSPNNQETGVSHMSDQPPDTNEKLVKTAKLNVLDNICIFLHVDHGPSGELFIQNHCIGQSSQVWILAKTTLFLILFFLSNSSTPNFN